MEGLNSIFGEILPLISLYHGPFLLWYNLEIPPSFYRFSYISLTLAITYSPTTRWFVDFNVEVALINKLKSLFAPLLVMLFFLKEKLLYDLFLWVITFSKLQSHYKETVYFLPTFCYSVPRIAKIFRETFIMSVKSTSFPKEL